MIRQLVIGLTGVIALAAPTIARTMSSHTHAVWFHVESPTFAAGAELPRESARIDCGGGNDRPEIRWTGSPPRTRSFALTVFDPDARGKGFWHWVRYDIPARAVDVPGGLVPLGADSAFGIDGLNSYGENGYNGPCPPRGRLHHYIFTLYALDVAHLKGVSTQTTGPLLTTAMKRHIIALTSVTATYIR